MSLRFHRKRLFSCVRKSLVGALALFLLLSDFAALPLPILFDAPGVDLAHAAEVQIDATVSTNINEHIQSS